MIKTFEIKGFRLFKELTLTNLNRITIFGGKNNSGKTSVLESLFMFYDRGNPEVILRQLSWRNIYTIAINTDSLWAPIFNCYDLNSNIEMRIQDDDNIEEKVIIKHNSNFFKQITLLPISIQTQLSHIKTDQKSYAAESLDFEYFVRGLPHTFDC